MTDGAFGRNAGRRVSDYWPNHSRPVLIRGCAPQLAADATTTAAAVLARFICLSFGCACERERERGVVRDGAAAAALAALTRSASARPRASKSLEGAALTRRDDCANVGAPFRLTGGVVVDLVGAAVVAPVVPRPFPPCVCTQNSRPVALSRVCCVVDR